MAIIRSPKHENIRDALKYTTEAIWDLDDVEAKLDSYVKIYGGNPESAEYRLAVASLGKAMVLMEIVEDNVRELARKAHREDMEAAKTED